MEHLCGPLRVSAISAYKDTFDAETAEVRRVPQRSAFLIKTRPATVLSVRDVVLSLKSKAPGIAKRDEENRHGAEGDFPQSELFCCNLTVKF